MNPTITAGHLLHERFGSQIMPWTKHVRASRDLLRRTFEAANKIGDLTFAAYSCHDLNRNLLAAGDPLPEVQSEAENGLEFAEKARFDPVISAARVLVLDPKAASPLLCRRLCFSRRCIAEGARAALDITVFF